MVIEAKLEVRDSASWDTLDKAIDRLGGTSAVNATAAMEGQAAAAAAAAADALSPGESDDEEGTGERCIIPCDLLCVNYISAAAVHDEDALKYTQTDEAYMDSLPAEGLSWSSVYGLQQENKCRES